MILRNHGVVTCGETLEEALYLMTNVVAACESQVRLMSVGIENIQLLSEESVKQVRSIVKNAGTQVQGKPEDSSESKSEEPKGRVWKIWDLEFESQMRMLDNAVSIAFFFRLIFA
jgi:adducin